MNKGNLNFEADDLQITSNLQMECLPQMLKECLSVAKTPATRDMLLMSMLTATSSVMNHVSFRYAHYGKQYYPNLLTFLMAGAASGKGVATLATKLIEPIHNEQALLIPGDSTYPAFFNQLYRQQGIGLLFETEGSVITDIWRTNCANYNTALRKSAEHETLSKSRVREGVKEIHEPKVSALLTGTCGQFQALVPSIENGFFSRLNILMVRDMQPFDASVFMPTAEGEKARQLFQYWGNQLLRWRQAQTESMQFELTPAQAHQIGAVMQSEYGAYLKQLGDGFHATIVRNGITLMRVACILSVLRSLTSNLSPESVESQKRFVCTDEDFATAMVISTKLLLNAADAYNQIGGHEQSAVPAARGSYQKDTFLASLPQAFSTGECVKLAQQMGAAEKTARRWIENWIETGLLEKTYHGHFQKIAV